MQRVAMIVYVCMGLMLGCATTRHTVGYEELVSTDGERGCWITNPSCADTREEKGFTGISHRYKMEVDARNDALKNARQQIIDAAGVHGQRKIYEVISSVGVSSDIINPAVVSDEMTKLVSEAFVQSKAKKWYVEKWKKWIESGPEYSYKVYVLVLISNEDVEEQMKESILKQAEATKDEQIERNINRALELMKRMESKDW